MTSQQHDHPLRFMNTIDPIETALAAGASGTQVMLAASEALI